MKRYSKSTHIHEFISSPESQLNSLLQHAEKLKNLQLLIYKALPPELHRHCQVANFQSRTLTLATDHANWATRIRYNIPGILKSLHQLPETVEIKTIRVIVLPNSIQTNKSERLSLNKNTANTINEMANTINDPEISMCLKRLGSHRKKVSK